MLELCPYASMSVLLTISVDASETALGETFDQLTDIRFEMENTVTTQPGQQWPCMWARGHSKAEIERALREDPTVNGFEEITAKDDALLYDLDISGAGIALRDVIQEENGAILAASGEQGQWEFKLRFRDKDDLTRLYDRLEEEGITPDVQRIHEFDEASDEGDLLTDPQREAFETAIEQGYFEIPRETSLEEIASEMEISHQAASERLRRGYERLIANELGEQAELSDEGT